jgi:hypothetical protein
MPIMPAMMLLLADPTAGPIKAFGDWVVACDNRKHCEMTSLLPGDGMTDPGEEYSNVMVAVARAPGPAGGFTVELMMQVPKTERIRLTINAETVGEGTTRNDRLVLTGAAAEKVVAAMLAGDELYVLDSADTMISRTSLKGSSAALRFIDAEQGRAGTVTAVAAKGSKPASAVPAPVGAPVVRFVRPSGAAAAMPPALRKQLDASTGCGSAYEGGEGELPQVETFALGGGKTLALLPCGSGAYNFSTTPFILSGGKAVLAAFDAKPHGMGGEDGGPELVNASFDARTGILGSYSKGRGLGDCGSAEDYVWDGATFRLVESRQMIECRGSVNWLTVWKATAAAQ